MYVRINILEGVTVSRKIKFQGHFVFNIVFNRSFTEGYYCWP